MIATHPAEPRLMGILNVTPDSFSDGGRFLALEAAVAHGRQLVAEGADLLDIGGESTRPGAQPVPPDEQIRRVVPVIRVLRAHLPDQPISIDTTHAAVARAALDAGASWINDTSAGRDDPAMLPLAAERAADLILMHRQGMPETMQDAPRYTDVVDEVAAFLSQRIQAARAAGVRADRLSIDPGIGFGKRAEHNLALLAQLDRLVALGPPVVLGASRKRVLSGVCQEPDFAALMPATCATTALGVMAGVAIFRVHDVAANRQAARVAWAIRHLGHPPAL